MSNCPHCKGKGYIVEIIDAFGMLLDERPCTYCSGTGEAQGD